jgi:hypothetical protein
LLAIDAAGSAAPPTSTDGAVGVGMDVPVAAAAVLPAAAAGPSESATKVNGPVLGEGPAEPVGSTVTEACVASVGAGGAASRGGRAAFRERVAAADRR